MATINFVRGEFQTFRAITKFHLGAITTDINPDDEIQFDGTVLRIGDKDHNLPSVKGAINAKWLVPMDDTTTVYRPQASAGMSMHNAAPTTPSRGNPLNTTTVQDEERNVGSVKSVRTRGDGIPEKKKASYETIAESSEGVVLGKIRTPATSKGLITSENSMSIQQKISSMDNTQGAAPTTSRIIRETAQVFHGSDEELASQLPDSVSTGHQSSPESVARALAAREERQASLGITTPTPKLASNVVPTVPVIQDSVVAGSTADVASAQAKINLVRAAIPDFQWDLSAHWQTRAQTAMEKYGTNPLYLNGILAVESDAVKTEILKRMSAPRSV